MKILDNILNSFAGLVKNDKEIQQLFLTEDNCIQEQPINEYQYLLEKYKPQFNKLQPSNFIDYIGQEDTKRVIQLEIAGCKEQGQTLRHILLYGSAGLGKTTLAKIIAKETNVPFFEVTASGIDTVIKMVDIVEKVNKINIYGSILFIDEIHTLKKDIQTHLYSLMTDNRITLANRDHVETISIVPLTVMGATNFMGQLDEAFRSRFALPLKLLSYTNDEMRKIIGNSADRLKTIAEDKAIDLLALNCRKSPRVANNLLITATRLEDGIITATKVNLIFRMMKIYPDGLQIPQINILHALLHAEDGALGLGTLAKKIGEDEISIKEEWEDYLLKEGYITVARGRGREITEKGKKYILTLTQNELFRQELEDILR